jgi:AcrR family transcriptional regulator
MKKIKNKKNHSQNILKTSRKLFIKYNYDAVSMNDIAKSLGITKAALYYYFPGKRDLYLQIIQTDFELFQKNISNITEKKLETVDDIQKMTKETIIIIYKFLISKLGIIKYFANTFKKGSECRQINHAMHDYKLEIIKVLQPLSEKISSYKGVKNIIPHEEITALMIFMINSYVIKNIHFQNNKEEKINAEKVANKILAFIF